MAIVLPAPGARGVEITIFDPELDSTGQHASDIVQMLAKAVAGESLHEDFE